MEYFYRIEHRKSKIGPYRSNHALVDELGDKFNVSLNGFYHKSPYEDGLEDKRSMFGAGARFGFTSLAKLKMWWGHVRGVYEGLAAAGFRIVRYEVGELFSSNCQSIANIYDMKNPVIISIDQLFS